MCIRDSYKEELLRLKQAGIPGIKLHPAYQNVDLDDIRMMRIIDEASSQGLITLVHAGDVYKRQRLQQQQKMAVKNMLPGRVHL